MKRNAGLILVTPRLNFDYYSSFERKNVFYAKSYFSINCLTVCSFAENINAYTKPYTEAFAIKTTLL